MNFCFNPVMFFYDISIDANFNNNRLTYSSKFPLSYGDLVKVPLGKRMANGIVVSDMLDPASPLISLSKFVIKEVSEKIETVKLPYQHLKLFEWMSRYYHYSLAPLVYNIIPPIKDQESSRPPKIITPIQGKGKELPYQLTKNQDKILIQIKERIISRGLFLNKFTKHYIWGITGSGKTSIYIDLIKDAIAHGRSVLYLIPEINLSPQTHYFFKEYLNCDLFIYHSGIQKDQKERMWRTLSDRQIPALVIGTRSAIFLPVDQLGLIIVDEEHDQSYKQEDHCAYNARDVAIKRAELENIPIVMGSATPSIECYNSFFYSETNFEEKKFENNFSYQLHERVEGSSIPHLFINSLVEIKSRQDYWPLSEKAIEKIRERLMSKEDEQVIVFVNRLGFSNFILCRGCGKDFQCKFCSTKLRYFKERNSLECQYCSFKMVVPIKCPDCQCLDMRTVGFGTEKVVSVLTDLFPQEKIVRFDRDIITNKKELEKTLELFSTNQARILVGTQMVSKGHNFKNVNLVVILGLDSLLNFPDFRNNEKIYQMVTQVSGRSGRYSHNGEVFIDTYNPDSQLFSQIKRNQYREFYNSELTVRKECNFPPYSKMAVFYALSKDEKELQAYCEQTLKIFDYIRSNKFSQIVINGPISSFVEKKKNYFTSYFIIRSKDKVGFHQFLTVAQNNLLNSQKVATKFDIDPYIIL